MKLKGLNPNLGDICAKFDIPNLPHFPDIGQNSDRAISDFSEFLVNPL